MIKPTAFIAELNVSSGFCCFSLSSLGFSDALNDKSGFIWASGAWFFSFSLRASSGVNLVICFPLITLENASVVRVVKPVISIIPILELLIYLFKAPRVTSVMYALKPILAISCLNLTFCSSVAAFPSSSIILERLYASLARNNAGGRPDTSLFNDLSCLVS